MLIQALASVLKNASVLLGNEGELIPDAGRPIDVAAYGTLAVLLTSFLSLTVYWFLLPCQNTSAGGFEHQAVWVYALLLVPYLCVMASVFWDLWQAVRSLMLGQVVNEPVHNDKSGV